MTCKIHFPAVYDTQLAEFRCLCGLFRISELEAALDPRWQWLVFRRRPR